MNDSEERFKKINESFQRVRPPKWILLILYLVIISIYIYFVSPVLNPIYKESYFFIFINIFIIISILFIDKIFHKTTRKILKYFSITIVIIFIALSILSSPIINSQKYYNLIGDVKQEEYNKNPPDISTDKVPIVDDQLAKKLGDKVLGEDVGLGSQFTVGEYYLISTPDDLAWVAPLEPISFFKWLQNKEGSPGYIYVSATNPNDVRLVQNINGKKIHLKYTDQSFFNSDIKRHAYLNKNFTKGTTDYSFEIDDSGNPYWIITTYKPTIGFSGNDVSGIIVVDAQTGESTYYDKNSKDIPDWIDRIYPKNMIQDQLKYYGLYKNGWLNTILSQKEIIQPTGEISYAFIDNKPYFYSGMTSIQNDDATVGITLTNIMTKETVFYTLNGATENAARQSAQGKVQQYNYVASAPLLMDIYNKPTYFMTLKDDDGLIKQYAYVSVENYNVVGIGSSVENAQRDYYNELDNNNLLSKEDVQEISTTKTIERLNYIDQKYYITLNNDNNLYTIDDNISKELPFTKVGDTIKINYIDDKEDYKTITKFDNESLN